VCAGHPPPRFITSHVRPGKKTVIVCDSGEEGEGRPQLSEAEALAELLAGPALLHDRAIADAFSRVLAHGQRP